MSERKTPLSKRIGIIVIGLLMISGTVIGLISVIMAAQNSKVDPNTIATNKAVEKYNEQMKEYEKQQEEQRKKMRALDGYTDKVGRFNADDVKELTVETLKEGDGATVDKEDSIKVNYTGWLPSGTIFDSTKMDGSNASPTTLSLKSVIDGWAEGLTGKKVGGVYLLTIPSNKAYGDQGTSRIPANTPLKFIVEKKKKKKS